MSPPPIYVVIDTNVLLDIYSCHDVVDKFDAAHARLGSVAAAFNDSGVKYRLTRARESLLLAMYLHNIEATTPSLHGEFMHHLTTNAPPPVGGQFDERGAYAHFFIHFVKDRVLPAWNHVVPTTPGTESGNVADRALLDHARSRNAPLITNEGNTQTGIQDIKLRKNAKGEGVDVFTPREFYTGKLDEPREVQGFLKRFHEEAPRYLADRRAEFGEKDLAGEALGRVVLRHYRMVLLGETL